MLTFNEDVLAKAVGCKIWEGSNIVCDLVKVEVLCYILYSLFGTCKVMCTETRFLELKW